MDIEARTFYETVISGRGFADMMESRIATNTCLSHK